MTLLETLYVALTQKAQTMRTGPNFSISTLIAIALCCSHLYQYWLSTWYLPQQVLYQEKISVSRKMTKSNEDNNDVIVIGIAGGSGAGKVRVINLYGWRN